MTERNTVRRWDVVNAQWTCASCHGWRRDHLETGHCLFGPESFREMTSDEFVAFRDTQVVEMVIQGVDQYGNLVKESYWDPR